MNYKLAYDRIIAAALMRGTGEEGHHITPKCIGGPDVAENVVLLTMREHYVCHILLARIYPKEHGLKLAAKLMAARSGNSHKYDFQRGQFILASKKLVSDGWARKRGFDDYDEQCATVLSEYLNGDSTDEIARRYGLSGANVQKSVKYAAELLGRADELRANRRSRNESRARDNRSKYTPEQEERRIAAVKAVDRSEYAKRLSSERKGAGNPMFGRKRVSEIITCPHCGKIGATSQMKRWHMDNCKEKVNG